MGGRAKRHAKRASTWSTSVLGPTLRLAAMAPCLIQVVVVEMPALPGRPFVLSGAYVEPLASHQGDLAPDTRSLAFCSAFSAACGPFAGAASGLAPAGGPSDVTAHTAGVR
jgi:hypothetical protein